MKNILADFYIEYCNDFLTVEKFAAYHEMSEDDTLLLVSLGRKMHAARTGDMDTPEDLEVNSANHLRMLQYILDKQKTNNA